MLAGLVVGCASIRWPAAPLLASALTVCGWLIGLAAVGAWTASCPDCPLDHDDTRTLFLLVWVIFYGPVALGMLASVWVGVAAARLFSRLNKPRG